MNTLQAAVRLAPRFVGARSFSNSGVRQGVSMKQSYSAAQNAGMVPATSKYQRVQQLQSEWGKTEHELYAWQKRGSVDSSGYIVTMTVTAAATLFVFYSIWGMSWPKKAE